MAHSKLLINQGRNELSSRDPLSHQLAFTKNAQEPRFSTLIRVLDGQGLWIDSGSQGGRGYKGDYLFAWLGGSTALDDKVWRVMAQLGSRLFFLMLGEGEEVSEEDLIADSELVSYKDRLDECTGLVHEVLTGLFGPNPEERIRSVSPQVYDIEIRRWLARFAKVLTKARGSRNLSGNGRGEHPYRSFAVLNNLAHGHAIVHGREKVTMVDLPVIAEVTISSMPTAFSRLFRAAVHTKELAITEAQEVLGKVHRGTAEKRMKEAAKSGIFEFDEGKGSRPTLLRFAEDWKWCNSVGFKEILGCFQNSGGVSDDSVFGSSITSEEEREEAKSRHAHTLQKMETNR